MLPLQFEPFQAQLVQVHRNHREVEVAFLVHLVHQVHRNHREVEVAFLVHQVHRSFHQEVVVALLVHQVRRSFHQEVEEQKLLAVEVPLAQGQLAHRNLLLPEVEVEAVAQYWLEVEAVAAG